jgi:integrase
MSKATLSVDNVRTMPPGSTLWDATVKGFGCRRQRKAAVYFLKFRIGSAQRWYIIGRHGSPWTTATARAEAKRLLGEVAHGRDPSRRRATEKAAGTFDELADEYLRWAAGHKKPRSTASDESNLRVNIRPALGRLRVVDIASADIARLHHEMADTPGAANRCLALLSKMFNLAERWGLRPIGSNPTKHAERYKERKLERFLSDAEMRCLGEALGRAERAGGDVYAIAAIRLLALTGARRGEVLGLKWADVDIERRVLRLPDSKTGAKIVRLSAPAMATLASLPRMKDNEFVIIGRKKKSALVGLPRIWHAIRDDADLPGLRLHDLRHSFASVATGKGLSLRMIGWLLGHSQPATTQRYAHLADDPAQAASEAVAGHIAAVMAGENIADVVPIGGRR